jgi:hypothetical protein
MCPLLPPEGLQVAAECGNAIQIKKMENQKNEKMYIFHFLINT